MLKKFKKGLMLALVLTPLGLMAQSNKDRFSEIWVVEIPFQQINEFEKLIDGYIKKRQDLGSVGSWQIYKAQSSSHLDSYLIRHCCFDKGNRGNFESWLKKNDLQIDWSESDLVDVADFEYFFSPVSSKIEEDNLFPPKVAVSQFTLQQGVQVKSSINNIRQRDNKLEWGEDWAWTFEDYSKGLLNFNFEVNEDTDQFELEQMINDLQFKPELQVNQSRYLVYNLVEE